MAAVKGWSDVALTPREVAYPEQKPFAEAKLRPTNIHTVHYWQAGNPEGKPVVFL